MTQPWQTHDDGTSPVNPVGQEAPMTEAPVERPKQKANNAFVMLLLVFCAALAVIYIIGMRKPKAAVASDVETEAQFDTALAALAQRSGKGELTKNANADQIVQMFYNAPKSSQVKAEDLPGNPFDLEIPDGLPANANMSKAGGAVAEARPAQTSESASPQFRLQSIIVTRQMPTAMINNKLCTIGSKLGDWTVTEIDASQVVLSSKGGTIQLKMERPNMTGGNAE